MSIPRPRTLLIGGLFLAVVIYSGIEARALIEGPRVHITSISDGVVVNTGVVQIAGTAAHIQSMRLDGRTIFTDTAGNFSEELLLPLGYTILSIQAEDRFGRKTEQHIHLFRNS